MVSLSDNTSNASIVSLIFSSGGNFFVHMQAAVDVRREYTHIRVILKVIWPELPPLAQYIYHTDRSNLIYDENWVYVVTIIGNQFSLFMIIIHCNQLRKQNWPKLKSIKLVMDSRLSQMIFFMTK